MSEQAVNPPPETPENIINQVKEEIKAIQDFAGGLPLVEEKIIKTRKSVDDASQQVKKAVEDFSAIQSDAETKVSEMQKTQSELQQKIVVTNTLQDNLKNILEAVQNLQKQAEESTGEVNDNRDSTLSIKNDCEHFLTAIRKAAEETDAKKNQFETDLKALQESATSLQSTLNTLSETINNEKAAAATITAQFHQQFSEAQETRLNNFNAYMRVSEGEMEALKTHASDEIAAQKIQMDTDVKSKIAALTSQVETALQSMEEKNQEASKLLEAVGVKTHTYNYAAVSAKESTVADWLRIAALVFMTVAVTVLVVPSVIEAFITGTSLAWEKIWESMLTRLPISLVLLLPAGYLISESSTHRNVARENKRIELELAALTPYLELFGDDKKQSIKEQLVKNYFVGHNQEDQEQKKEEAKSWIQEIVPEVVDKVLDRMPNLKS